MSHPTDYQLTRFVDKLTAWVGDVATPAIANKRCIEVSKLFRQNHGGELVVAYGARDVTGPSDAPGHVAVLIGDLVYDWTARQFWPDVPCPLIERVEDWGRRFTGVRGGGMVGPLVETYDRSNAGDGDWVTGDSRDIWTDLTIKIVPKQ